MSARSGWLMRRLGEPGVRPGGRVGVGEVWVVDEEAWGARGERLGAGGEAGDGRLGLGVGVGRGERLGWGGG